MADNATAVPDSTAVRAELWRAMPVQLDPPQHVRDDEIDAAQKRSHREVLAMLTQPNR